MAENTDEIKPALQYVVFITEQSYEAWLPDHDNPDALDRFLDDSRANGWSVWRVGHTAYVFSVGGLS